MNASSFIRALVLGDVMLDLYTRGRADRLSPEAPIPVLQAESEEARLGGAGAVATLLAALDVEPLVAGIVGDDALGEVVTQRLMSLHVGSESALSSSHNDKETFVCTADSAVRAGSYFFPSLLRREGETRRGGDKESSETASPGSSPPSPPPLLTAF